MNPTCLLAMSLILVCSLATRAPAQPKKDLLEFALGAHRAARDALHSFECRVSLTVDVKSKPPSHQTSSAHYWYSPHAIRVKVELGPGRELDYCWKDGISNAVTRVTRDGQTLVSATRNAFPQKYIDRTDALACSLIAVDVPGTVDYVLLEELVKMATTVVQASQVKKEGRELVLIELAFAASEKRETPWNVQVFLDPAVNHLVQKLVLQSDGRHRERAVEQFQEFDPGVFFPVRVTGSSGSSSHSVHFTDVRINRPLPKGIFDFRFPNNVILADGIQGASFRVDAEGKQISASTPMARVAPPKPADAVSGPAAETEEEPRSWTEWLLPISLGVLFSPVIVLSVRWLISQRMRR